MIEAVYAVSLDEYVEAQKLWCSASLKKLPGRRLIFIVSVAFGICVGASFHYLPLGLQLAVGGTMLLLVAVSSWRKKAVRAYQFKVNANALEEVHVRIDEEGYRDERPGVCGGWMGWNAITGWREGPKVFVLGRNFGFVTVPKGGLGAEQQAELRAMLSQRYGLTT
jgi:hypothetical protein